MPPTDTAEKAKKNNFGSRILGVLRSQKSQLQTANSPSLSKQSSASALPAAGPPAAQPNKPSNLSAKKKPEVEDEDVGMDTVPQGQVVDADKKFALQPLQNSGQSQGKGVAIPEAEAPRLVYLTSYGSKVTYPLIWEETTIGRKDDNQIVLTDATISKCHCSVFRKADGVYVMDRRSSNGVRVNDQFIPPNVPMMVRNGDCIMVGSIKLLYYASLKESEVNQAIEPKKKTNAGENHLKLVTILPPENQYDEQIAIKAEIEADDEVTDFKRVDLVDNINTLKDDYEKLRLAYELSKITLTIDINAHLEKSLDLIFEILPVDRGVVLLVDQYTGTLATQHVKLRNGYEEDAEIVLSSTILKRVYESRKCLVTMDASKDASLQAAASVMTSKIRSVVCLPLIAHNKVHGIIHLDADDSISSLSYKDLSIVKAISNQTAIAIENSVLMIEQEANARVNEQLSRFLAPHVVAKMTDRSEIIKKGGRQLVGTIIFVDIRGFTNLSEKSTPVEVVHMLNDYFERLVTIVFKYNGVVDKYIGDALMAVFGTLEDDEDAEFRAVSAALEFKLAIKAMNEDRARFGKDPISIGVGLNTGELLVGFIGSSQRLEYTCIGDTVNTSSRVCSMAKHDQVLISEFTYNCVASRVEAVQVGARMFKGKQKEVMVYEVFGIVEGGRVVPPPAAIVAQEAAAPEQDD